MTYDIFNSKAPAMPKPSKGTEFVKLLLSQVSKDMQEPLFPMFFPVLGAHVSGSEMQYPDLIFEGTLWPNGQSDCRFVLQQGSIVEYCGSHLPRQHNKTGEIVMQPRPYYLSKWYIFRANLAHFLTFIVQGSTCFNSWRGSGCNRDQYRIEELK